MEEIEAEEVVSLRKRSVAELVGTFALVFAAAGSSMASSIYNDDLGKFAVAAAPGLVIIAMTFALDKVSGAYFNPAISIRYVFSKHLAPSDLAFYIGAQIAGTTLASLCFWRHWERQLRGSQFRPEKAVGPKHLPWKLC